MTDDETDREVADADALDTEARLGAAMAGNPDSLITLLGHFYRGQLDRETTWRARLDRTTNWAVIVIATLLTWTFSGQDNPHYILLVGVLLIVIFLAIEAHRYRAYDVPRSRVRMLEEDLFAQLFAPDVAVEHDEWRRLMSEDLRRPAAKVTVREAVGRRLRRVYLPLTTILLAAWVVKLAIFQPEPDWLSAAGMGLVPGPAVLVAVAAFYGVLVALAAWPQSGGRREIETVSPQAWKRDDE